MPYSNFTDLVAAAESAGSLGLAAIEREVADTGEPRAAVMSRMEDALQVMREAVAEGLFGAVRSRSGLVGGDAALVAGAGPRIVGDVFTSALCRALAVGEVNAAMGRIVAAPTGGASGVLPSVLLTVGERVGASDRALVEALFTAGAIGGVIASRATLSGAVGGCQAEIGSGAAMAAAAAVHLWGGTAVQCGHAASLALQGLLGLVCDPIGGLVEVPCVVRNATGTAVALAAAEMALAGVEFPVPLDEVVSAQASVGKSLPSSLRETALGGLAATPTGRTLGARARTPG